MDAGGEIAQVGEPLASRMPIPVTVVANLEDRRLPEPMEVSVYFFVSESLANVVKHARATQAEVKLCIEGEDLVVDVRDDGVGGAAPAGGTGLAGLADRIAALDGDLVVASPPGPCRPRAPRRRRRRRARRRPGPPPRCRA